MEHQEGNMNDAPQDITNIENNEDINLADEINLDEDYVINWDNQNTEDDAIQERETETVSLGERAEDSEEVDGSLRLDTGEEEYADEGEGEEEGDIGVELGEIQHDEADEPEYEDEDEYEEDYEDEDGEPDEWDKLVDFLEEYPGATPADYVKMTEGWDNVDDDTALKMKIASDEGLDFEEDAEEIDFLFEDKYGYDEELDSERDIKLKRIASKKALREAKEHIAGLKEKYGADLRFENESPEFQEAVQFQQEQQEIQAQNEELATSFHNSTKDYFGDKFKGFEFNYGDGKSQTIRVGNNQKVAEEQSDISNFINKYVGEDGTIEDIGGYHKALWAAQNADALFSHAYEQGKADAVRSSAKNAKNIDMDPRSDQSAPVTPQSRFKLEDEGSHTENFKFNF